MADDGSGARVTITVAVIGLIGVLGSAMIANWDKLARRGQAPPPPTPSPVTRRMGPIEPGINLQGSDFSPTPILVASPEECLEKCDLLESCRAMTFVRNPNPFGAGDCWLKSSVPVRSSNPNMASAVKRSP